MQTEESSGRRIRDCPKVGERKFVEMGMINEQKGAFCGWGGIIKGDQSLAAGWARWNGEVGRGRLTWPFWLRSMAW